MNEYVRQLCDMELKVIRKYKKSGYTIGYFMVDGVFFGNSMEDKDRKLFKDMPIEDIRKKKVYGETAIPCGRYRVLLTYSSKFASRPWASFTYGKVPLIENVPGFSGIRIHPLNKAEDSLGCIGIGKNDKKGWISMSTDYYTRLLKDHLLPAWQRGEEVFITID